MALNCFNAYHSYLKSIEPLNDAERGRLFTALLEYSSTGAEPELRGNERYIFPTMKEQIDRDIAKYEAKCAKNRESSAKGGAANAKRWEPNGSRSKPNGAEREPNGSQRQRQRQGQRQGQGQGHTLSGNSAQSAQEPPGVSDFGFAPDLADAVNDWLAYKQERREAYKPVGLKSLLTQIKNAAAANGDAAVAAVIRQSMSSGYKGIVFDRLSRAASKPTPNSKPAMECSFAQPTGQDVERMKRLYDKLKGADDDGEF